MSISTLPLSYCTNVHPGMSVDEVISGLESYTAPMRQSLDAPLAAGLWLAHPVIEELMESPDNLARLNQSLRDLHLQCYTLNAFPYGNFHSERVKEQVYLPDWSQESRRVYTERCAQVLSKIIPEGVEGSLSTVPLGFKGLPQPEDFEAKCIENLLTVALQLNEVHDETGCVIRLAIEPEPLCLLETTAETVVFFGRLFSAAEARGIGGVARRHLGVCFDVCHQAVEFEDVSASIQALHDAEIRINKVHISCALRLTNPAANTNGRKLLSHYVEPRYLHQTIARTADGGLLRQTDLDAELCENPSEDFLNSSEWRVHFHVPVNVESYNHLETTRPDLRRALQAVSSLEYAPHLEVETYTWRVMEQSASSDLVENLTAEIQATQALLDTLD